MLSDFAPLDFYEEKNWLILCSKRLRMKGRLRGPGSCRTRTSGRSRGEHKQYKQALLALLMSMQHPQSVRASFLHLIAAHVSCMLCRYRVRQKVG